MSNRKGRPPSMVYCWKKTVGRGRNAQVPKADNMLSILWLLRTRGRVTAKQLAESLEIHVRSVYRYIDALCASGVPIVAEAGPNGGYSLLPTDYVYYLYSLKR